MCIRDSALPGAERGFALAASTLVALQQFSELVRRTPLAAVDDAAARRAFLDGAGEVLDPWRAAAYGGAASRAQAVAPAGLLTGLARDLLPLVDASLRRCRRDDGLYDLSLIHIWF